MQHPLRRVISAVNSLFEDPQRVFSLLVRAVFELRAQRAGTLPESELLPHKEPQRAQPLASGDASTSEASPPTGDAVSQPDNAGSGSVAVADHAKGAGQASDAAAPSPHSQRGGEPKAARATPAKRSRRARTGSDIMDPASLAQAIAAVEAKRLQVREQADATDSAARAAAVAEEQEITRQMLECNTYVHGCALPLLDVPGSDAHHRRLQLRTQACRLL